MTPELLFLLALSLMACMAIAWLIQQKTGNSGWVDTIWSAATGGVALIAIAMSSADHDRKITAIVVVALWSLRLAGHIGLRSKGATEDPRYAALAEEWGEKLPRKLFVFLQIQAVAAFVLVISVQASVAQTAPFGTWGDWMFIALALVALLGEAISDRQLASFRSQNAGRKAICETGLWRFSRHPNYFFEWLFWCAWPLMAFASASEAYGVLALSLAAPVMMYWLLVHVSGIPPLEAHMRRSRKDAFEDYQQRVNAFFPGPRHVSTTRRGVK